MRWLLLIPRVVVAVGLAWLAWPLLYFGTHDASLVTWECGYDGCSTNDFASVSSWLGAVVAIAAAGLAARILRGATVGAPLVLIGLGTAAGWRDSVVDLGVSAESVRWWLLAADTVTVIGTVAVITGGAWTVWNTGVLNLLRGRSAARGRVHGWKPDGEKVGTGIVSFVDKGGRRHDVAGRFPNRVLNRPVTVYYDPASPGDAATIRIGFPRHSGEDDLTALRAELPIPGDVVTVHPESSRSVMTPAHPLIADLERLSVLRDKGRLTDTEYQAAKRLLLEK